MSKKRDLPTVSAVLIVKDEEDVLDACLASVAWADEIVVYDTGSTDTTVEIARRHTDVVIEGYWDDDFGAARNRALAHATGDWILVIDADEVFEGDPRRLRLRLGTDGATLHLVALRNLLPTSGMPLDPQRVHLASGPRLFRRGTRRWQGRLHEQLVEVGGAAGTMTLLPGVVLHHSGYLAEALADKDKSTRNIDLALEQVAAARAADLPREIVVAKVNLARSYSLAQQHEAALALADETLPDVWHESYLVQLAQSAVDAADVLGDRDAVDRWLDVWERDGPSPVPALHRRVAILARRGDVAGVIDALDRIPTTTIDADGVRWDRIELLHEEIWALCERGDKRRAVAVAERAARRGRAPGSPEWLVQVLGVDHVRRVVASLDDSLWQQYVTQCALEATPGARAFLAAMADVRPGAPEVLAAAVVMTPALSLEEAATWSAHLRRAGAAENCPLVAIATEESISPVGRALAGALAYSAFGDERGLAGLTEALALVSPEDEAELAEQLQILAPGLVSPSA